MTKREAAIVSAYTGYMLGNFSDMLGYIEEIVGHPVFIHQLADIDMISKVEQLAKKDFISLEVIG